uniref:Uncharacterized protein n=1 Tax=Setaria italica TaxID=4555 RepID=K3YNX0_SETIT
MFRSYLCVCVPQNRSSQYTVHYKLHPHLDLMVLNCHNGKAYRLDLAT